MMKLREISWRVVAGFSAVLTVVILTWSAVGFIQYEKSSFLITRLFLQLERAIGYDGFIHNYKNYVLRPGDDSFYENAIEDYGQAQAALEGIRELIDRLSIDVDLYSFEATLIKYRRMLDRARDAQESGLSISEVDERVQIPDAEAGAVIRDLEQKIFTVIDVRQRMVSTLLAIMVALLILAALSIAYVQFLRRRQIEQYSSTLMEKEAMLLQAERIAHLGRWKIEADGSLIWSRATMEICGVDPEAFPGTTEFFWSIIPPEDQAKVRISINKAAEAKGEFVCIHRITRPDGGVVTVCDCGEVVTAPDGSVIGFVGTLQDISVLVDVEDKLRQSQKMEAIGNLAGGLAHDFNNILAVVMGNLELLKGHITAKDQEKYLNSALNATQQGAELTRNMLSFARKSTLQPTAIMMNDFVREVINWSARLIPANIHVETSLLANLWKIDADQQLAQNALLNLILNARDAMLQGGRLTIETANIRINEEYVESREEDLMPGRYVMLAVTDTGDGISDVHLSKIFDPFFTTKAPGSGTGLGLSMVLGFMKQSGGTVRVYSELGVGTTFKLYFKVADSEPTEFLRTALEPVPDKMVGARILIVEDNEALLDTQTEVLISAGFVVETARTGDEAWALWISCPSYDAVLTDIVMPGKLQGMQLARKLREKRPELPVIFMSGYPSEAAVHGNGIRQGDIRLMKPVGREKLIEAVVSALKNLSATSRD